KDADQVPGCPAASWSGPRGAAAVFRVGGRGLPIILACRATPKPRLNLILKPELLSSDSVRGWELPVPYPCPKRASSYAKTGGQRVLIKSAFHIRSPN